MILSRQDGPPPAQEQPPPAMPGMPAPGFKADESRVPTILASLSLCLILTVFSTALRVWARMRRRITLALDDYLMIIATLVGIGEYLIPMLQTRYGYGTHIWNVPPQDLKTFFIIVYMTAPINAVSLTFCKVSILAFYYVVFSVSWFRKWVWGLVAASIAWGVVALIGFLNLCTPPNRLWDPSVPGRCINIVTWAYIITALGMAVDLGIFLLPIPLIWSIMTSKTKRFALAGIFSLGLAAVLSCVMRLPITHFFNRPDVTYEVMPFQVLAAAENALGIICGNFPVIYPMLAESFKVAGSVLKRSITGSGMHDGGTSASRPSLNKGSARAQSWKPLGDSSSEGTSRMYRDKDGSAVEMDLLVDKQAGQVGAVVHSDSASNTADKGVVKVKSDITWNYEPTGKR